MIQKKTIVKASCHCGSVQLNIFLSNGLDELIRCNCSICKRAKGFAMICLPQEDVQVIEGRESITEYIFNTASAPHFFCIVCGIHTHHKSRSRPDRICINIACIDELNLEEYNKQVVKLKHLSFVGVSNEEADVDKFCNNDVCDIPEV